MKFIKRVQQKKTHTDYFRHCRKRALERYELDLTQSSWESYNKRIRDGDATFLFRQSSFRTHWLMDDQYIVVYESTRKGIVTFLPPEAIYNYLKNHPTKVIQHYAD